jgi:hypothetical protein
MWAENSCECAKHRFLSWNSPTLLLWLGNGTERCYFLAHILHALKKKTFAAEAGKDGIIWHLVPTDHS